MEYNYLLNGKNRVTILVPKFTDSEDFGIVDLEFDDIYREPDIDSLDEYTIRDGQLIYIGKTQEKIDTETRQLARKEIRELREKLASLDYVDNKLVEALATGNTELYTELCVKYASVFAEKQGYRDRINELEALI